MFYDSKWLIGIGLRRSPVGCGVAPEKVVGQGEIRVGIGSCCVAKGSDSVRDALESAMKRTGSVAAVKGVGCVGCVGMCHHTPLVEVVAPNGQSTLYSGIAEDTADVIVGKHFQPKGFVGKTKSVVSRTLDSVVSEDTLEPVRRYTDVVRDPPVAAFLSRQRHLSTEQCGVLGPTDFNEYRHHDGFKALEKCLLEMIPAEVVDEVVKSRLRGRGGGGFPTGSKWLRVREAPDDTKYVICNGDGNLADKLGKDAWGRDQKPADLTKGVFKGGDTKQDVYRSLMTGIDGTAMAGFQHVFASPDGKKIRRHDAWRLTEYILSLHGSSK